MAIINLLLDYGCSINTTNKYGNNPLSEALFSHSINTHHIIAGLIIRGADMDSPNLYGNSARSTAQLIANYDYKPLFIDDLLTEKESMAIISKDILDGAPIRIISLFAIDGIWDFKTRMDESPQNIRVTSLSNVVRDLSIHDVMKKMNSNQVSVFDEVKGQWHTDDILSF